MIRKIKYSIIYSITLCLCIIMLYNCKKNVHETEYINGFEVQWNGRFSKNQMNEIRDAINSMVFVQGGTFLMGAQADSIDRPNYDVDAGPYETPVHEVSVGGFYISNIEVTQGLWKAVMNETPNDESDMQWEDHYGKGDNYPAYRISYNDASNFISKLNEYTGLSFTLPTEAQWEYAARGGVETQNTIYSGSNDINSVAWTTSNANSSKEVKTKSPNALGLYDMSGNVWEMCLDWYMDYTEESVTDPICEEYGEGYKVFRGGSWNNDNRQARVSCRYKQGVHYRDYQTGIRLVHPNI